MPNQLPIKKGGRMAPRDMERAIRILGSIFMAGATQGEREELSALLGIDCDCGSRVDPGAPAGGERDA